MFALRSKQVLTPNGIQPHTVVVADGVIQALLDYQAVPGCPVEDLADGVLMPGLVDCHVHINEPGRTEWEGFATATQAAAAGGITTLVDMPLNCIPVTTSRSALLTKLDAVRDQLWVDCGFWGGVVPGSVDDLDDLLAAGVLGVKSFLIDSGIPEFPNMSADDLRRAMPVVARHQVPYLIHAEYAPGAADSITTIGNSYPRFLASRPDQWEIDAIQLMVDLAKEQQDRRVTCHVHIVHLSTAEALSVIRDARRDGLRFTVETCPHYLTLCAEQVAAGSTLYKCCPPIRGEDNRQRLWQAVREGGIDFIVSDHSPCTPALKLMHSGDIGGAWGGIAALQFGLPLIWAEARTQGLTLPEVSRLMSQRTAAFIGLGKRKGQLAPGFDADLLLFDETRPVTIDASMIRHRHKITPYIGRTVVGQVLQTWLCGNVVFDGSTVVGHPRGQAILRTDDTGAA